MPWPYSSGLFTLVYLSLSFSLMRIPSEVSTGQVSTQTVSGFVSVGKIATGCVEWWGPKSQCHHHHHHHLHVFFSIFASQPGELLNYSRELSIQLYPLLKCSLFTCWLLTPCLWTCVNLKHGRLHRDSSGCFADFAETHFHAALSASQFLDWSFITYHNMQMITDNYLVCKWPPFSVFQHDLFGACGVLFPEKSQGLVFRVGFDLIETCVTQFKCIIKTERLLESHLLIPVSFQELLRPLEGLCELF